MASIPGVRFDITGASGSQGLLSPKEGWRCYILPRGGHASQDSTGTTITFDSAAVASRYAVNRWIQVALSTDKIRQVSAVGGNSIAVSGAAVTVSENDRILLIGNTQPTVTGGSATYTVPDTIIRQRDDDAADLYTNSMITTDANGLVQFFSQPTVYDAIIQDGNQANQGLVADIEVGTAQGISTSETVTFGSTVTFLGGVVAASTVTVTGVMGISGTAQIRFGGSGNYIWIPADSGNTQNVTINTATATLLAAGGGVVQLGPGTFTVSAAVVVGSSTTFRGSGMGVTTLRFAADALTNNQDNPSVIVTGEGTTPYSAGTRGTNINIEDLTADFNFANQSGLTDTTSSNVSSDAINMQFIDRCLVRNCEAKNAGASGIFLRGCADSAVDTCRTTGNGQLGTSGAGKGNGITVSAAAQAAATGNRITGCVSTADEEFGIVVACSDAVVSGNNVDCTGAADGRGIEYNGGGADRVVIADNTVFNSNTVGIAVNGGPTGTNQDYHDIAIHGNIIDECVSHGIQVINDSGFSALGIRVQNNTIRAAGNTTAGAAGISLERASDSVVSGNVIVTVKNSTGTGIRIVNDVCARNRIEGNIVRDIATVGIDAKSGDDSVITRNTIIGCTTFGIRAQVQAGSSMSQWTITDNYIKNIGTAASTRQGIQVASADGVAILDNVRISGNYCTDDQATRTMTHGVQVNSTVTDVWITDNFFVNMTTGGINESASPTGPIVAYNNFLTLTDTLAGTQGLSQGVAGNTLTLNAVGDFFEITGNSQIHTITASWPGRLVTMWFGHTSPGGISHGSNILLAGGVSFAPAQFDAISLRCNGVSWFEATPR